MYIPTISRKVIEGHRTVRTVNRLLNDPFTFLYHAPSGTRSKASRPKPISTRDQKIKRLIPHSVPNYNSNSLFDEHSAKIKRAALYCAFQSGNPSYNPLTSDDLMIVLDSGCSIAMTPNEEDFIHGTYAIDTTTVNGIGSGLQAIGIGDAEWTFEDTNGSPITIRLRCLHVPDIPTRLLSPQQLAKEGIHNRPTNGAWIGKTAHVCYEGRLINFPLDRATNLPMRKLKAGCNRYEAYLCKEVTMAYPAVANLNSSGERELLDNLNNKQRKLLQIHHRLGHKSMATIQQWADRGLHGIPKEVGTKSCSAPICLACQYGKAKKRPKSSGTVGRQAATPGAFVSVDTMHAGTPGIIPFATGRPSRRRYNYTTLWVDMVTKYIHATHLEAENTQTVIQSKLAFERFAKRFNRTIKHIHSDNDVFNSKDFDETIATANQTHTKCGVGAKHPKRQRRTLHWNHDRSFTNHATSCNEQMEPYYRCIILAICILSSC